MLLSFGLILALCDKRDELHTSDGEIIEAKEVLLVAIVEYFVSGTAFGLYSFYCTVYIHETI